MPPSSVIPWLLLKMDYSVNATLLFLQAHHFRMAGKDATVTGAVIEQRLRPLDTRRSHDPVRLPEKSPPASQAKSALSFAWSLRPANASKSIWGHFGALNYNGDPRKLYAFCLVECHSRKMSGVHPQPEFRNVRALPHACLPDPGRLSRARLCFDNLATAVAEHDGNLVRFNPRFLAFAREYGFIPRACHVAAAWEKGKVERAIGYVRQNFWPLRSFADLSDVNRRRANGFRKSPTSASTARRASAPMTAFSPRRCGLAVIHPDYRDSVEAARAQRSPPAPSTAIATACPTLCRSTSLRSKPIPAR